MNTHLEYDELVYDGRITKVHRVGLRLKGGEVVERDFIHYPGAAVVLPVLDDGRMVLIRQYRFAVDEELWELPAGILEPGEPPEACAARELTEETGCKAGRIEVLGGFFATPGTADEYLHAFLATGLTQGPQNLEKHEEIDIEVLPQQQVRRMVAQGVIHDAKTIATLALYWTRDIG